jgi:dipeptidyl aminopeptidase/acylaminoacyl peptidase
MVTLGDAMDGSSLRAFVVFIGSRVVPAIIGCYCAAATSAVPAVDVFGSLPVESLPIMSRDGRWLASVERKGSQPRVVIFDLAMRQEQRAFGVPDGSRVGALRWNDNHTLLISVAEVRVRKSRYDPAVQYFRTIAVDATSGAPHFIPVMDNPQHTSLPASIIGASQSPKPNTVIMRLESFCKGLRCIAEVDTNTGKISPIAIGNAATTNWVIGRDGRPAARLDWDFKAHAYHLYALNGSSIKEIYRQSDEELPILAGLLRDSSAAVLLTYNGRPHRAAWAVPLDGSPARLLVEEPDDDIVQGFVDGKTGGIIGVIVSSEDASVHWLEPLAQQRFDAVQRAFPGKHVSVFSWTDDEKKLLARVQTASTPPVNYLVDLSKHTAEIASEEYPALARAKLGEVTLMKYPARDGTPIPAFLTLPPDKAASPVPLLVLARAAAYSRDYPSFNWFTQYFATRGYAVLQPQHRGSTGFGEAFYEAGLKQWGGLMQDDVTDGVRAMVEQGVADPQRVCILGEAEGGYFALAGAAFTPELFACAVSINGISDLQAFMRGFGDPNRMSSTMLSYWRAHLGDARDPILAERSPINAAKSVRRPVLLIYDPVPGRPGESQSEKMARALKDAGKPVTTLELPVDEPWGASSALRVRVLTEIDRFLTDNLGAAK